MRIDKLVKLRLDELDRKAMDMLTQKTYALTGESGTDYYYVDVPSFRAWASSALNVLHRICGSDGIHYRHFDERFRQDSDCRWASTLEDCKAILRAATEDYEGGCLFDTRGLIQAEVFDSVLEQAVELLEAGYKDAACVVAGVALETTLKELCIRNQIVTSKLDKMNADLAKAGEYNIGMQKQITAWADRRNRAAHGDWGAYSADDVQDIIRGVTRLIAEHL